MKGIYLCARKARHDKYNIVYNDIDPRFNCDIIEDCTKIDLKNYDYIIATPPCNYWSICNYRRETSKYAQLTKHLLKYCIEECIKLNKPFIVENVRNAPLFKQNNLLNYNCYIITIGRHTYRTNIKFNTNIEQRQDFKYGGKPIKYKDTEGGSSQGGYNVYKVVEEFLKEIHRRNL